MKAAGWYGGSKQAAALEGAVELSVPAAKCEAGNVYEISGNAAKGWRAEVVRH